MCVSQTTSLHRLARKFFTGESSQECSSWSREQIGKSVSIFTEIEVYRNRSNDCLEHISWWKKLTFLSFSLHLSLYLYSVKQQM